MVNVLVWPETSNDPCKELEGCYEALTSDLVMKDLEDGKNLNCITEQWALALDPSAQKTGACSSLVESTAPETSKATKKWLWGIGLKILINFFMCFYSSEPWQLYVAFNYADLRSISITIPLFLSHIVYHSWSHFLWNALNTATMFFPAPSFFFFQGWSLPTGFVSSVLLYMFRQKTELDEDWCCFLDH